ncbi:MAG: phosphatidate cytidylyltransferase [Clostridia bacterium]|nr:phosphatidate cytidylyltransferase [Clostridia bacterium]
MKDKIKVGLILTLCLLLCLVIQFFSSHVFDFIIFMLAFMGTIEFRKLQLKAGYPAFDYCPEIACFLVFVVSFTGFLCNWSAVTILLIVFAIVLVFYLTIFLGSFLVFPKDLEKDEFRLVSNMSIKQFAFFKANNTLACMAYPTLIMFFMYFINHISNIGLVAFEVNTAGVNMGFFGLILLFAICCLSDTFAMLLGCLVGGKKIFPKISPKKTLSGCLFGLLGGLIGSIATYFVFASIYPAVFEMVSFWQFAIIGVLGSVVSQAGDLFESYIKRKANVKDAGDIFRSHGGMLDRFDSIIFTTPYIFICLLFLFA